MAFTKVCPECGFKSGAEEETCPGCGARKGTNLDQTGASDMICNEIDSKIDFIERPSFYVKIIISIAVLFGGIFLLPEFIARTETFWMIYITSNVFTIIKKADKRVRRLHGIYYSSLALLSMYTGAGIGNLISHAGRTSGIYFSYFFNHEFISSQAASGNSFIYIGAAAGLGFFFLWRFVIAAFRA